MRYEDYLRSDRWKAIRAWAMKLARYQCQRCGSRLNLNTHHLTYVTLGAERPDEVRVLCRVCHLRETAVKQFRCDDSILEITGAALMALYRSRMWDSGPATRKERRIAAGWFAALEDARIPWPNPVDALDRRLESIRSKWFAEAEYTHWALSVMPAENEPFDRELGWDGSAPFASAVEQAEAECAIAERAVWRRDPIPMDERLPNDPAAAANVLDEWSADVSGEFARLFGDAAVWGRTSAAGLWQRASER